MDQSDSPTRVENMAQYMHLCSLLLGIATGALLSLLLTIRFLERDASYDQGIQTPLVRPSHGGINGDRHHQDRRHILYSIVQWDDAISARAIKNTWATHIDSIHFYSTRQNASSKHQDEDYVLLRLLKSLCTRDLLQEYQWYIVLSGSTYVRTGELARLLRALPLRVPVWAGREAVGRYHCTGDIVVLNRAMLEWACTGAWLCKGDAKGGEEVLEFSRCLHDITGLTCHQLSKV